MPRRHGTRTFRIWRGADGKGEFEDYTTEVDRGHGRARRRAPDPGRAGARSRRALELQGRQVRLVLGRDQRQAEAHVHDAARRAAGATSRSRVEPMRAFPHVRDLVTDVSWNFEVKKKITPFTPRKPDAPDGTWRMQQEDVDRVQEFRKCIECFLCQDVCHVLRDHHKHEEFIGPRFLVYAAALEMHPLDTADRIAGAQGSARHRLLQHHQVLHEGVPGAHHDHRQRDHPAEGARRRRVLRSVEGAGAAGEGKKKRERLGAWAVGVTARPREQCIPRQLTHPSPLPTQRYQRPIIRRHQCPTSRRSPAKPSPARPRRPSDTGCSTSRGRRRASASTSSRWIRRTSRSS